eukprot:scaffold21812_cov110-Isochrysis_galbana.AAC.23
MCWVRQAGWGKEGRITAVSQQRGGTTASPRPPTTQPPPPPLPSALSSRYPQHTTPHIALVGEA